MPDFNSKRREDMSEEILFSRNDIFNVVEGRKQEVKKRVESIPANTILNASEHDLVQALVEEFQLHVPVLKDEESYIAHAGETHCRGAPPHSPRA
jgi:hypothetical protein